jgi:hypothetical protein
MSLLRDCILPVTLGLMLAPAAWAGDDDKTSTGKKGEEQKVWGVVSEVTVIGETDIDFTSRKAVTAESTIVTIIGHPARHDANYREGVQTTANSQDRDKDRDVRRTSSDSSARSGERPRHRMNVYVLAISPKTKVCEVKEMGKEGSASAKEEACEFDKLEVGDRVEVTFEPKLASKTADDRDDARPASQKFGRHRTYFGTATAIRIMEEPARLDRSGSNVKNDRSGSNDRNERP